MKSGEILNVAVMATLAFIACMYALKYELSEVGLRTSASWWPPANWRVVQLMKQVKAANEHSTIRLKLWAVLMWMFLVIMLVLLPFALRSAYLVLFGA